MRAKEIEKEREGKRKFPSNEFDYENGFDKMKKETIVSDTVLLHH